MLESTTIEAGATSASFVADDLPPIFCWTKMGVEAGQDLDSILRRKELERLSGGVFAWGIGNSVGPAVRHAHRLGVEALEVLFTRMKSAPKAADVSPGVVMLWDAYEDDDGAAVPLPGHVLVTSRGNTTERDGLKKQHYALLCRSQRSLLGGCENDVVDAAAVCNLVSRNPTGASQVTAVVCRHPSGEPSRRYPVEFRAQLAGPGFVRLVRPTVLTGQLLALYRHALDAVDATDWRERVQTLRLAARPVGRSVASQGRLFDA